MKYYTQSDGEWFQPSGNYRMACCECGLVHRMQFRVVKGHVQFRAWRDNRGTAQKRRHLRAIPFEQWWTQLLTLAKSRDLVWLLSYKADHKDAWKDGLTPAEELESQADEARMSE